MCKDWFLLKRNIFMAQSQVAAQYKSMPTVEEIDESIKKEGTVEKEGKKEREELIKDLHRGTTIVLGDYIWYLKKHYEE